MQILLVCKSLGGWYNKFKSTYWLLSLMDELKPEIKIQDTNQSSYIPVPTPHTTQQPSGFMRKLFLAVTLAIITLVVILILSPRLKKAVVIPQASFEVTKLTGAPAGELNELVIERKIIPSVYERRSFPDGTVELKWVYTSETYLGHIYNTEISLISKRWQVIRLDSVNPDEERSLKVVKGNLSAVILFNKGDGKHAIVDITLTVPPSAK